MSFSHPQEQVEAAVLSIQPWNS